MTIIYEYDNAKNPFNNDGTGRENNYLGKSIIEGETVQAGASTTKEVVSINETKEDDRSTRRVPSGEGIMDNKKFNDVIYAYMQSISNRVPEKQDRYVWKANFIKKDVAKLLKINFRTFQRKFDYLVENGYIVETDKTYELPRISDYNFYIPVDTLKYLATTTNEDVIAVYSYLGQLKKSMDKKAKKAYTTKSDLLIRLGYKIKSKEVDEKGEIVYRASTNQKDWEMINNVLDMLDDKLKLVECRVVKEKYKDGFIEKIYFNINTSIIKKGCFK